MENYILEAHGLFWWRDEAVRGDHFVPAGRVPGLLRINKDGHAQLELHDSFPIPKDQFQKSYQFGELLPPDKQILGVLKDGSKFVLLDSLVPRPLSDKFTAYICVVGNKGFPVATKSLEFSSLEIDLTALDGWLRHSAIKTRRTKSRIMANYKILPDLVFPLTDGELRVRYDISGPFLGEHRDNHLSLSEKISLLYVPAKGASLYELKNQ